MASKATVVGLDIGFGWMKANGVIRFPSVIGQVTQTQSLSGEKPGDGIDIENIHLDLGATERLVGEAVFRRRSPHIMAAVGSDQANSEAYRFLLFTALGLLAEGDGENEFHVVTGLPCRDLDRETPAVRNHAGRQLVKFRDGGRVIKDALVNLKSFTVLPQPLGTLFDLYVDDDGEVVDKAIYNGTMAVVDIGFETTDLLLVHPQLQWDKDRSPGLTVGMRQVFQPVGKYLQDRFGLVKKAHEVERIIAEGGISIAGEHQALDPEVLAGSLRTSAEDLWHGIIESWPNYREFDRIYVTGGGAMHFGPYLREKAPHIVVVEDSQMANSRGYRKAGKQMVKASV